MTPQVALLEAEVRPLRRVEYEVLARRGAFTGERVELLYGRIVTLAPQGEAHAGSVQVLTTLLVNALGDRAAVRVQLPLVAPDESEPEPDLAVVRSGDPFAGHPSWAYLVIEVAQSSQLKDRGPKGALYAAAGVPEFWLVDVDRRRVERYRRPLDARYSESSVHTPGEVLALLEFPDVTIPLDRILPPA